MDGQPDWYDHPLEIAHTEFGAIYKKKGGNVHYMLGDSGYYCASCEAEILEKRVSHAVHDGPFPLTGSGKVEIEYAPIAPIASKNPHHREVLLQDLMIR